MSSNQSDSRVTADLSVFDGYLVAGAANEAREALAADPWNVLRSRTRRWLRMRRRCRPARLRFADLINLAEGRELV